MSTTETGAEAPTITLAELHTANIARQAEWCPDQVPDLSFRGNELGGECGEAQNVIKKLERERQGWAGSRATLPQLAEELADVVICADLCAVTAGIDLGAAVIAKFNATSEKVGLKTRLSGSATLTQAPDRELAGLLANLPNGVWGVEHSQDGDAIWVGVMRASGSKLAHIMYGQHDLLAYRSEYAAQHRAFAELICRLLNDLRSGRLVSLASPAPERELAALDRAATQGEWKLATFFYRDEDREEHEQVEGVAVHNADGAGSIIQCNEREARFIVALVNAFRSGRLVYRNSAPALLCPDPARYDQGRCCGGKFFEAPDDEAERCVACNIPFKDGDRVLSDHNNGGILHAACCGPERESYTDGEGDPLPPDAPIPQGWVWRASAKAAPTASEIREAAARLCEHPNAGLVPPDGGDPTPAEMLFNVAEQIRSLPVADAPAAPAQGGVPEKFSFPQPQRSRMHDALMRLGRAAIRTQNITEHGGAADAQRECLREIEALVTEALGTDRQPALNLGDLFMTAHAGCAGGPFIKLRYETLAEMQRVHTDLVRFLQAGAAVPPAPAPVAGGSLERVRHVKRGFEYEVLGEAEGQVSTGTYSFWPEGTDPYHALPARLAYDGATLTIYRCTTTGKLWWRFPNEFRDGRFVTLSPETTPVPGAEDQQGAGLMAPGSRPTDQTASRSGGLAASIPSRETRDLLEEVRDLFPPSDEHVGYTPFETWRLRLWRSLAPQVVIGPAPAYLALEGIEGLLDRLSNHVDTERADRSIFAEAAIRFREYHPEARQIISENAGRWSAWSEDDCDGDPRIDPGVTYTTDWYVGCWRTGEREADAKVYVGSSVGAASQARQLAALMNLMLCLPPQDARAKAAAPGEGGE